MEDTTHGAKLSKQQLEQIVETAFAETPMLYANGFVNGVGLTDGYLILQANGRSIATINMPLSMLKSLGQNLNAMIESYERQTGQVVPTLDDLQRQA